MRVLKIAAALLLAFAVRSPVEAQSPPTFAPPTIRPMPAETKGVAAAFPRMSGNPSLTREDLEPWLDGFMPFALARSDIAGAVVVVVKDGQVLLQKGYGFADVARRKRVDPATTLFRPGSTSKLFTWTAVMQLVEQGKIDLDRDVNAYLDFEIPPYGDKPVTMRNIMTHTAGFEESVRYLLGADQNGVMPLGEYVKRGLPKRVFAPGTTPAYSNYATALAGYIVGRTSGMSFDDYVERNVLRPIGMNGSSFRQPLPPAMKANMAQGYAVASGKPQPYEMVIPAPAGSLAASGADMAKFMIAHLEGGRGLLRPETARVMHNTTFTAISPLNGMALGFYEQRMNGRRTIGHGGDIDLFHSDLWLIPSERLGVFISLNSGGTPGAAHAIRAALFDQFGDRYFPVTREAPRVDAATAREHAQAMAGSYTSSRGGFTNFLRVLDLVGQPKLGVGEDGELVAAPVTGLANQPRRWVEIAPYVWRDAESGERLAAKVEDGRVARWSFDTVSPFTVFDRAPWYRDSTWLSPAAMASLAVVLLTALAWPVGAIARRRYKAPMSAEPRALRLQRLTHGFAWATIVALGLWAAFITIAFADLKMLGGPLDWLLWLAQLLTPIALFGLLALAAWNLWQAWTVKRGWLSKSWSILLLLAAAVLLWVAIGYNLIGFGTSY